MASCLVMHKKTPHIVFAFHVECTVTVLRSLGIKGIPPTLHIKQATIEPKRPLYQSAAKDRTGDLTCYVFKFCLHHVQQTCIICSAYRLHVTKLLTSVIDHYFHTDGSKYLKNPLDVGDSTARGVVICVKAA